MTVLFTLCKSTIRMILARICECKLGTINRTQPKKLLGNKSEKKFSIFTFLSKKRSMYHSVTGNAD